MNNNISDDMKKSLIISIINGLDETRNVFNDPFRKIKNSIHFYKMDEISNAIINDLESNEEFKLIYLKRGRHIVTLVYYIADGTLFSFMSKSRFETLIKRTDLSHIHYFDGLCNINEKLGILRNQLVLDDEMFARESDQIEEIKAQVRVQLDGLEPQKYMSVVMEMNGLRLMSVDAILTSEYLEVAHIESWSEFIDVDYSEIEFYESNETSDEENDLGITLKSNVIRKDDITGDDIKPKVDIKSNQT